MNRRVARHGCDLQAAVDAVQVSPLYFAWSRVQLQGPGSLVSLPADRRNRSL